MNSPTLPLSLAHPAKYSSYPLYAFFSSISWLECRYCPVNRSLQSIAREATISLRDVLHSSLGIAVGVSAFDKFCGEICMTSLSPNCFTWKCWGRDSLEGIMEDVWDLEGRFSSYCFKDAAGLKFYQPSPCICPFLAGLTNDGFLSWQPRLWV